MVPPVEMVKGLNPNYQVGFDAGKVSQQVLSRIELVLQLMESLDRFSEEFRPIDSEISEVVNCVADLVTALVKDRMGFEVCPINGDLDERDVPSMLSILSARLQDSVDEDCFEGTAMTSTDLTENGYSKPYSSTISIG